MKLRYNKCEEKIVHKRLKRLWEVRNATHKVSMPLTSDIVRYNNFFHFSAKKCESKSRPEYIVNVCISVDTLERG